jgi:hypothetical protein
MTGRQEGMNRIATWEWRADARKDTPFTGENPVGCAGCANGACRSCWWMGQDASPGDRARPWPGRR